MDKLIPNEYLEPIQKSLLAKLVGYLIYVWYLQISSNLTFTYALLPLIFLLFNLKLNFKIWILFFTFILDLPLTLSTQSYGFPFYGIDVFFNRFGHYNYYYYSPVAIIFSIFLIYTLAKILAEFRKIKTYYTILFFVILTIGLMKAYTLALSLNNFVGYFLIVNLVLLSKKFWIIFILALELQYSTVSPMELLGGVIVPGASYREKFKLKDNCFDDNILFWRGVWFSLIFIAAHLLYFQLLRQFYGTVYPLTFNNSLTMNVACKLGGSGELWSSMVDQNRAQALFCYFSLPVFGGIVRSLLIDPMIFIIPGLMMGFRFPLFYLNFFKSKGWTDFLFRLHYYYSSILYRVFIVEFYKFILDVFGKRRSALGWSVIFGIIFGGLVYHIAKDFMLIGSFFKLDVLSLFLNSSLLGYFSIVALTCVFSELGNKYLSSFAVKITFVIYFIAYVVGRSFFEAYYLPISLRMKMSFVLHLLKFW